MKTPTIAPAVPGALGKKPAPPAVAMAIASQSLFVFEIAIRSVDFFRRPFVRWNPKLTAGPLAQIDEFAAFAAEGPIRIAGELGFFVASWTFHGRRLRRA